MGPVRVVLGVINVLQEYNQSTLTPLVGFLRSGWRVNCRGERRLALSLTPHISSLNKEVSRPY